jgi:sec-independent protein translocase protein TatA
MGALQPLHLVLIAAVVLLVFGPRKLPELARAIGESMKELKLSLHGAADSEAIAEMQEIGQAAPEIQEAAHPRTLPTLASSGDASQR